MDDIMPPADQRIRGTVGKETAIEQVVEFAQDFGKNHLTLACHAAFPLALTPDLLYQIWASFVPEAPWTAVADVLLSSLCSEVGQELYEMSIAVRSLLLKELEEDQGFGQRRLTDLGSFLATYVARQLESDDPDIRFLAQSQRWTALAYTKPGEAAEELVNALQGLGLHRKPELLRTASLVEVLADPLAGFDPPLALARGMASLARGNSKEARTQLSGALGDGRQGVRQTAAALLKRINEPSDVHSLLEALGHPENAAHDEVARELRAMGEQAIDPLIDALIDRDRSVSAASADLLTTLGKPAVEGLLAALKGDRWKTRWAVVKVLSRIGTHKPEIVSELSPLLTDSRSEVRQATVRALTQIGNKQAVHVLVQASVRGDEILRQEASRALTELSGDEVTRELRETFNQGADPRRVVELIARMETESAHSFLRELSRSRDGDIRTAAAIAMEAAEKSDEYYYQLWESSIRKQLLQHGTVTISMLSGIPKEVRPIVLQRYISSHPQVDLAYDTVLDALHLNAISRHNEIMEAWSRALQDLGNDTRPSGPGFSESVKIIANRLCDFLDTTIVRSEVYEQLYCFLLDVSHITHGIALPKEIPLLFLERTMLTEKDLDHVRSLLKQAKVFDKFALLALFGEADRLNQAQKLINSKLRDAHGYDIVILGKESVQDMAIAKDTWDALRLTICEQTDLVCVSPYHSREPVSRQMFFGRELEIRTITQAIEKTSVALLGNRMLGKISLLHRVGAAVSDTHQCCYLDCSPIRNYDLFFLTLEHRWPAVGSLARAPVSFRSAVDQLSDDRSLVFIFQHIDPLLRFDLANEGVLSKTFSDLSREGLCQFVFSGERVLSDQMKPHSKSPLVSFCRQQVRLGYLDSESALQLITVPMSRMGIELRDREHVVNEVIDITSCQPRLIQYVCQNLIKQINREGVRFIRPEHVQNIVESDEFYMEYLITVWGYATAFERALTLVLEEAAVTHKEIRAALRRWSIPYTSESLGAALYNLKICSVLEESNGAFRFVPKHFPRIAREILDLEKEIGTLTRNI